MYTFQNLTFLRKSTEYRLILVNRDKLTIELQQVSHRRRISFIGQQPVYDLIVQNIIYDQQ